MAITLLKNITKYAGTAAERAAMDVSRVNTGDTYFEWDTSKLYIYSGTAWVEKNGTVQIDNITAGNTVIGKVGIDPANNLMQLSGSSLKQGQKNVTTAGSAVVIGATQPLLAITIVAKDTNVGNIYIGSSDVTASSGFILVPGAGHSWTGSGINVANIYINSAFDGDGVSWTGVI